MPRIVALLFALAACESTEAPAPAPTAPADRRIDELPRLNDEPRGRYDATLSTALRAHFGNVRARGCGTLAADQPSDAAVACVRGALAEQHPFVVEQAVHGTDSAVARGMVGVVEAGAFTVYHLTYDSDPCGGGCGEWGGTMLWRCTAPPEPAKSCGQLDGVTDCFTCPDVAVDSWHAGELTRLATPDAEAIIPQLVGARPASLGAALGVTFGLRTKRTRDAIKTASADMYAGGVAAFDGREDPKQLREVIVRVAGHCGTLREWLAAHWGPSADAAWLDPQTHQRASLDLERCALTIEPYADVADWIDHVAHFDTLGKPAAPLRDALARSYDLHSGDPSYFEWQDIGFGRRGGAVHLHADVERGRIKSIGASGKTDLAAIEELRARLSARRGAPEQDDTINDGRTRYTRWPHDVTLDVGGDGSFELR